MWVSTLYPRACPVVPGNYSTTYCSNPLHNTFKLFVISTLSLILDNKLQSKLCLGQLLVPEILTGTLTGEAAPQLPAQEAGRFNYK